MSLQNAKCKTIQPLFLSSVYVIVIVIASNYYTIFAMSSFKRNAPVPLRKHDDLDAEGSKLLHLPQSDLSRSTRPNLVLMAMPSGNSDIMQAIQEGKCSILTNEDSSALVLPDCSYNLTTIGTTNTFIVFKQDESTATTTSSCQGRNT